MQQSLSATDVREMQQADAAVTALTGGSDYAQMTEDERTDAALQQLDALTAQGLVKQGSVYTDAENGMISFTYSCGALGGILLTDPEEQRSPAGAGREPAAGAGREQAGGHGGDLLCV